MQRIGASDRRGDATRGDLRGQRRSGRKRERASQQSTEHCRKLTAYASEMRSATHFASAITVIIGLTPLDAGNALASATYRPRTPNT